MALVAQVIAGSGRGNGGTSSMVVKGIDTATAPFADNVLKWRQLGTDSTACGTFIVNSGPDGTASNDATVINVAIDAGSWSEGTDNGSICLNWRGACYLQGVPPSRIYFSRQSPANGLATEDIKLRYITYR